MSVKPEIDRELLVEVLSSWALRTRTCDLSRVKAAL